MSERTFRIEPIDYATGVDALRAVREPVFVQEQQVPLALEWDELDPLCVHVIARDADDRPIGTGRLTPERKIGRMAVLPDWRGHGVGDALLVALLDEARTRRWPEVTLHAQVSAIGFYAKHGFVPVGARFMEAGIEHQTMRRRLGGATEIDSREAAAAMVCTIAAGARREHCRSTPARSIRACSTYPRCSKPCASSAPAGSAWTCACCCRTRRRRSARTRR